MILLILGILIFLFVVSAIGASNLSPLSLRKSERVLFWMSSVWFWGFSFTLLTLFTMSVTGLNPIFSFMIAVLSIFALISLSTLFIIVVERDK